MGLRWRSHAKIMLDTLITSKTRVKLLLKFFLNPSSVAYLRSLESEFGESTNAIRLELNRFEEAGMLKSFNRGNKKMFKANDTHPLFKDLRSLVLKYVGIDQIIETITTRLGDLKRVYLGGDYANGIDSGIIDLVLIGDINKTYLVNLVEKAEALIHRKIRYLVYDSEEDYLAHNTKKNHLLLWNA